MPSALSVDLRERVIGAIEAGASRRQAAQRFGVGTASAIGWHERFREEGEIAPRPVGGDRPPPAIEAHAETILEIGGEHPQIFLRALRHLATVFGFRPYWAARTRPLACDAWSSARIRGLVRALP